MKANHKYQLKRWSLADMAPATEGPALDKLLADFEASVTRMETWRDKLSPDMPAADFLAALRDYETFTAHHHRLGNFAERWFDENTQNPAALSFKSKIENLAAQYQNRILFFTLWWKGLDDAPAARLLEAARSTDVYYFLENLRHFKPYTLSEPEEKVINLKDVTGANALITLYEMLTSRFTFKLEVDGEVKEFTAEQLTPFIMGPDAKLRAAAYRELLRVYTEHAPVLSQIYNYLVSDWRAENIGLRKFASPIAVRNLTNDIPEAVVETLLDVCRRNVSVFQRYFRLKARWLGIPSGKLHRYDLYAPLRRADKSYPYAEAVDYVLDSFAEFSPRLAELARRVFDEDHIDSEPRARKAGGAYCASVLPGLTPWILMHYTGKARDMATLAHELGHAIHAMLAADHSVLTFHASLPLAETASVFSEILVTERLLKDEPDPAVRRDLLAKSVDDAYATVMRQAWFALFEKEAHAMIEQGKTADEIAERYLQQLREQFGDSMEVSDDFKWEWVRIGHFYFAPFYVYAYSFGQLLVLALYQMYKREGESFKPKYLKILSHGGSKAPIEILGEAGIDVSRPEFWQGGFDVISGMIDELEKME